MQGSGPGRVELNLVDCGSGRAVFVINKIVDTATQCDAGADFKNHGYEVPDETANVAYCASLVVPANVCFMLAGHAADPAHGVRLDAGHRAGVGHRGGAERDHGVHRQDQSGRLVLPVADLRPVRVRLPAGDHRHVPGHGHELSPG